jgi:putative chitinase
MEKLRELEKGASGAMVERLQVSLMHWGLMDKDDIDGIYGKNTDQAVRQFQEKRKDSATFAGKGLAIDGQVDKLTWAELLKLKPEQIEIITSPIYVTKPLAEAIFGQPIRDEYLDDLNFCFETFEITSSARICQFMAQIAHESGGLRWLREIASGWAYEGRADLGNTQKGDGPKFKGAGAIQLTGRSNYTAFSEYMKDPKIVQEGVNYVALKYPFSSAGFWWMNNRINPLIDKGATCRQVSARVNGKDPANGLQDRLHYYNKAIAVIK